MAGYALMASAADKKTRGVTKKQKGGGAKDDMDTREAEMTTKGRGKPTAKNSTAGAGSGGRRDDDNIGKQAKGGKKKKKQGKGGDEAAGVAGGEAKKKKKKKRDSD